MSRIIHINAEPGPVVLDLNTTALMVIDMQKDFLDAGGYGAMLGNDTSLLQAAVALLQRVLAAARAHGLLVIHTREGHLPDLSDCPPTKLERWPAGTRIGDSGPMGRILVRGERGHDLIDELAPLDTETVIDKPGKTRSTPPNSTRFCATAAFAAFSSPASPPMFVAWPPPSRPTIAATTPWS